MERIRCKLDIAGLQHCEYCRTCRIAQYLHADCQQNTGTACSFPYLAGVATAAAKRDNAGGVAEIGQDHLSELRPSEGHMPLHTVQGSDALFQGKQAFVDLSPLQPGLSVIVIRVCRHGCKHSLATKDRRNPNAWKGLMYMLSMMSRLVLVKAVC